MCVGPSPGASLEPLAHHQNAPSLSLFCSYYFGRYSSESTQLRGGSRAAATPKMECFVIIVNGFQPLTIITKHSILDVAATRDPPLKIELQAAYCCFITGYYTQTYLPNINEELRRLDDAINSKLIPSFTDKLCGNDERLLLSLPTKSALREECPYSELFWSAFPPFKLDTDQNNSELGHFLRSAGGMRILVFLQNHGNRISKLVTINTNKRTCTNNSVTKKTKRKTKKTTKFKKNLIITTL